jgi:hypothetical protein
LSEEPLLLAVVGVGDGDAYTLLAKKMEVAQPQWVRGVVYCLVYGWGGHELAARLHMDEWQAKELLDQFGRICPRLRQWKREVVAASCKSGWVSTLAGRQRRFTPQLQYSPDTLCMMINTVCQGSVADILRSAAVLLDRDLKPEVGRLVLQTRNEVLVQCRSEHVKAVEQTVQLVLQTAWPGLRVPLKVRITHGPNWGACIEHFLFDNGRRWKGSLGAQGERTANALGAAPASGGHMRCQALAHDPRPQGIMDEAMTRELLSSCLSEKIKVELAVGLWWEL